jgi:uncharacterized protein YehS (DUF1456 family)
MGLNNNDIIKKLRVALSLRDEDIVEILKLVDYDISKSELGAFFRKEDHEKFMPLQDQILRNFLNALIIHKRGPMDKKPNSVAKKRVVEKKKTFTKREDNKSEASNSNSDKKFRYRKKSS